MITVVSRVVECAVAGVAECCAAAGSDRLGRQDKKAAHRGLVGRLFCLSFLEFSAHRAS